MRNLDYAIKKTAVDMGLPEDKVDLVIQRYWKEIYQKMVHGMDNEKTTLFLRNLGLFTISKFKLNQFIKKKIYKIKKMGASEYSEEIKKEVIEKQRGRLVKSLVYRNLIAKDRVEKLNNKNKTK